MTSNLQALSDSRQRRDAFIEAFLHGGINGIVELLKTIDQIVVHTCLLRGLDELGGFIDRGVIRVKLGDEILESWSQLLQKTCNLSADLYLILFHKQP